MGSPFRLGRPTTWVRDLRNNVNEIEELLWRHLRRSQLGGFKFSRQIPVAGFAPDFVCRRLKLAIELDGSQHAEAARYDQRRTQLIERQGHVLRFWNSDLLTNLEGVLETILAACKRLAGSPPPTPSRAREGEKK